MHSKLAVFFLAGLVAPPTFAQGAADAGAQLYEENCGECHGEQLRATGGGPDLKKLSADERDRFDKMVDNGKGQMPAFAGVLSEDDKAAIWAYVRSRAR
jgi:mono/diheme cytochrome c family protein